MSALYCSDIIITATLIFHTSPLAHQGHLEKELRKLSRAVLKAESWKFKPERTEKNNWIWFCCSASVLGIRFRFNPISSWPLPFMSYAIQLWLTNTKYRHEQIQTDLKKEGVIRPHYLCCEPGNVSVKGSKTAAFMRVTGEIWFFYTFIAICHRCFLNRAHNISLKVCVCAYCCPARWWLLSLKQNRSNHMKLFCSQSFSLPCLEFSLSLSLQSCSRMKSLLSREADHTDELW